MPTPGDAIPEEFTQFHHTTLEAELQEATEQRPPEEWAADTTTGEEVLREWGEAADELELIKRKNLREIQRSLGGTFRSEPVALQAYVFSRWE